jgi:hypothetical protein
LLTAVRILVALAILWAVLALTVQVLIARGGGRRDYSKRSGSPVRGVFYNFTVAMLPAHKETIRRHPAKFAVGAIMHVGTIVALLDIVLLLVRPAAGHWMIGLTRPIVVLALLAGIYLFARRIFSKDLRSMSAPDDYIAILATCGLLASASLYPLHAQNPVGSLIYAGLLFVYLPLGKLRHVVFFFVARGDYGRRLGYRGVYPPTAAGTE